MSWQKTGLVKLPGHQWTARDANAWPTASEAAHPILSAEHYPDGTHRPPCPIATAVVVWNPGSAVYTLSAADGVAAVARGSVGRVLVFLAPPVPVRRRMLCVRPWGWSGDLGVLPIKGMELADSVSSPELGLVGLVARGWLDEPDGGAPGMRPRSDWVDCSFVLEVYGEPG